MKLRTVFILIITVAATATTYANEAPSEQPNPQATQPTQKNEIRNQTKTIPTNFVSETTAAPEPRHPETKSLNLEDISTSIENLARTIEGYKNDWLSKTIPAIFGLLGVLSGSAISLFVHHQRISHELGERKAKFSFEIKQKIFDYRNKQLNEFYGPLLVLLTQSKELSTQLHEQLKKCNDKRYQHDTDTTLPDAKISLFINLSETRREPFRLIEELPHIGVNHKEVLPQVNVIITTGSRMAKLIEEKSGLADPKNTDLSGCLGRYLAHLSALKDAYAQAVASDSEPRRVYNAVFPREIQNLVRSDYDKLRNEIQGWEKQADSAVETTS